MTDQTTFPPFLKNALRVALPMLKDVLLTVEGPALIDAVDGWTRSSLSDVERAKLRDVLTGVLGRL